MSLRPGLYVGADVFIGDHPLNTIDAENVAWVITDLDGWWGLPDVEVPDDPRPSSQDGSYYTMGRFNSRTINIKGHILPVDGRAFSAVEARNAFNRLLVLVRTRTDLRVREDGIMKVSLVQLASKPLIRINQASGFADFDIMLKATDPLKYSDGATYSEIGIESGTTGRTYKRMFNFSYGGAQQGNEVTVINRGSYESMPELYIQGPVVNPAIHNLGSGQTLAFDITLGPYDGLSIKPLTKQITMNGENRRNALLPYSRWFPIYPGNNYLKFTGTQQIPSQEFIAPSVNEAKAPVPMLDPSPANSVVATNFLHNPRPTNGGGGVGLSGWSHSNGTGEVGGNLSQMATGDSAGVVFDTNLAVNPRAHTGLTTNWQYQPGTGETTTITVDTTSTDTPNNLVGFIRRTVTAAKTGGTSGTYYRELSTLTGLAGDVRTISMWVRYSHTVDVNLSFQYRVGATTVNAANAGVTTVPANTWVRLSHTLTAIGDYDTIQVWPSVAATSILPVGGWSDSTQAMIGDSGDLVDYFDGAIGSYSDLRYGTLFLHNWTGTAAASSSTRSLAIAEWDRGPTGQKGLARHATARGRTGNSVGWVVTTSSGAVTGAAGDTIQASMWLRPSVDTTINLRTQFRMGTTPVGSTDTTAIELPAYKWTRVEGTALSTGAYDQLYMWAYQTSNPAQFLPSRSFMDGSCGMFLISANSTEYFDGGNANTRNYTTAWTGTALASTSTLTQTNRGWDADALVFEANPDTAVLRRPSSRSIRVRRKETRPTNFMIAECLRAGAYGTNSQQVAAYPSLLNGISVWARTTASDAYVQAVISYYNSTGNIIRTDTSPDIPLGANNWERIVYTADTAAPDNCTAIRPWFKVYVPDTSTPGSQYGAQTWFQDAKMGGASLVVQPYFDGSFVYASWAGTAHASVSRVLQAVQEVRPPKLTILSRDAWIE